MGSRFMGSSVPLEEGDGLVATGDPPVAFGGSDGRIARRCSRLQNGLTRALAALSVLLVEVARPGEVVREIDFDAAVVVAEVKGQLPLAVVGAEHVGDVALDAVLPDVLL